MALALMSKSKSKPRSSLKPAWPGALGGGTGGFSGGDGSGVGVSGGDIGGRHFRTDHVARKQHQSAAAIGAFGQPVDLIGDVLRGSVGQCPRDVQPGHDDRFFAEYGRAFSRSAHGSTPAFVLESLESSESGSEDIVDHWADISVAVMDRTDPASTSGASAYCVCGQ